MSTIHLPTTDWFQRGTRTAAAKGYSKRVQRLIRMLTGDAQRPRPPITLAGQRANSSDAIPERAPSPPPNEQPRWSGPPRGHSSAEPTAADGDGPYSHDELERMNRKFIRAVERAFKRGKESRQAAAHQVVTLRW